ncbi:signal peptide and transmembrane domain containing protein [Cryptosporidium canis]|uniref:GDT1 family protein n=1 Tax=Cryptosporidium canis TaxID=195482 RepID=A0A9D5DE40_9CRYT|nr:signal peptide and transmembrane domain containing protein [Cryptosporidium canis]
MLALAAMTLFACLIGFIIPNLFTPKYTHYASCALFLIFGVKSLYDGIFVIEDGDANNEFLEVKAELDKTRKKGSSVTIENKMDPLDTGNILFKDVELCNTRINEDDSGFSGTGICKEDCIKQKGVFRLVRNKSFIQAFTLTALAEWGDRSQVATILLSAYNDPFSVFFGSMIGHSICTGLACYGGKYLSRFISPRMVTISGGVLFLAFAFAGLIFGP